MYGNGRLAFTLASAGVLWSLALVPAAFFFPAYHGESSTSSGASIQTTATLVGVNGVWIVGLLLPFSVLAVVAWLALRRSCSTGSRRAMLLGQGIAWLLLAYAVLTFSLGLFVIPAALLMLVAALRTPSGA